MPDPVVRRDHAWSGEQCPACGLRRSRTWVLDDEGRAVQALVWSDDVRRHVRAIAFPWMRGVSPPLMPRTTLAQAFPHLAQGREPPCEPHRYRRFRTP